MPTGKQLKNKALDSLSKTTWVQYARDCAIRIAREWGSVTTDDLRRMDLPEPPHPNCWGAIFRGRMWEIVDRVPSGIVSNHAREIRVWGLR